MADNAAAGSGAASPLKGAAFDAFLLLARVCVGYQFIYFGSRKFLNPPSIAGMISSHGLPGELVYLVIPFQFCLGLCIVLGFFTRAAAVALAFFCMFAPAIFWADNFDNFSRDLGSATAFWLLFAAGAGRYSLDAQFRITCENFFGRVGDGVREWGILLAVARFMLAIEFLGDALRKLSDMTATQAFFAGHDLPVELIYPVIGFELVLAFLLILGFATRYVAVAGLAAAAILAFYIHARGPGWAGMPEWFWGVSGYQRAVPAWMSDFAKDLGTIGAFAALLAFGPGRLSLDEKRAAGRLRTAAA
jgi:putative oxidoreductase